jgi:hypothetical protein
MRAGRVLVLIGSVVALVGAVLVVLGMWMFASPIGEAARLPTPVPAGVAYPVDLNPGPYFVAVWPGPGAEPLPGSDAVRVVNPDGAPVQVLPDTSMSTATTSSRYRTVARFMATDHGRYTITLDRPSTGEFELTRGLPGSFLRGMVNAFAVLVVGGVSALGGLTLLVVGVVLRVTRRPQPVPAGFPPPR